MSASSTPPAAADGGFFAQPRAVWAVAFAAVVSFMGLGLVDPILPAIADDLHASQSQVLLLFTSYFAVTGIAMLVSSTVASRIGPKRTLLAGLTLIVLFAAAAGASDSVGAIVGLRAGWGLGNALFIATALSAIIGAASGGVGRAVILYEAALGLGISVGPLLGGLLGGISWRGPFFGVAALMAIGFVAVLVLLDKSPKPPASQHTTPLDPLRALALRPVRASAVVAFFYNFGFFTLLAYSPFPLHLGAHQLGFVFFGWGVLLAGFSVFGAPRIAARVGDVRALGGAFGLTALVLLAMGLGHGNQALLIGCVIVAGAFLGVANTILTQLVMESAPINRATVSASYSFVRFTGGAIAPYLAGKLGEHVGVGVPFLVAAGAVALGIVALYAYRTAFVPAAAPVATTPAPVAGPAPTLVAVGGPEAPALAERAVAGARRRGGPVHVLHVRETAVVGDGAYAAEDDDEARATLDRCVAILAASGLPVSGETVAVVGSHAAVADEILARADALDAGLVVLGQATRHGAAALLGPSATALVAGRIDRDLLVLRAQPAAAAPALAVA
ncbi:MFS transporter [Patulibacter defluvii]|uniref:MFS transporter n=1 Tax=Patulibacter defluvii TaxID=3095358 RepID=UPI002A7560A0|nr:MFS transporter [Patulibacter sp. DM4]